MTTVPGKSHEAAQQQSTVDPRLLQANERTMLAWLRTGIALMTFGFVIARIGIWLRALAATGEAQGVGTAWIGAAFVGLGVAANAMAVRRFLAARRTILAGEGFGQDSFPVLFGVTVAVLGALLGAYILMRLG